MKGKLVKDALILTIITLVSGLGLGFVYEITKEPIRVAKEAALIRSYKAVFEDAEDFEDYEDFDAEEANELLSDSGISGVSITFTEKALDSSKDLIGYVIGVKSQGGYGGPIEFSMGVTSDGELTGYSITSISETAGLGMKADQYGEKTFSYQWIGKDASSPDYAVKKDGGEIEAISGATITSRCMTNGINGGIAWFNYLEGGAQ